jgi:hypothetical protein
MIGSSRGWTSSVLLILIAASVLPFAVSAGIVDEKETVELVFEIPDPVLKSDDGRMVITVDGWGSSSVAGQASLPERTYYLPVESIGSYSIESIELKGNNKILIDGEVLKAPFPATQGRLIPDNQGDGLDTAGILGLIEVKDFPYLVVRISPFDLDSGLIEYPDTLCIHLEVKGPIRVHSIIVPSDMPDPTVSDVEWTGSLWNPGILPSIAVSPGAVYHNQTPPVECLIITSSALNSSLQPLAGWKTQRGVYTEVIETSYIYSNWNGVDNQEKIRNCIKDHYDNESLKWVILGGDNSVVPSRMAYVPDGYGDSGSDGSTVPADGYYGDIKGTGHTPYDWDGDNDGNYGEYSTDGIDLSMEVYVGRLSATSSSAMTSLVNNILNYEKNPPSGGWYNRTVLAGAFSNFVESGKPQTDEAKMKEAIRTDFLDNGNFNNYTLYEGSGIVPSSFSKNATLTTTNLVNAITTGAFMVNLAGHGSNTAIYRTIWTADSNGNGYCDSGESSSAAYYSTTSSPSNGGRKPLFYNDACNNGNFDQTFCLTEDILRDVGIGAVGSARVSWYAVGWTKGSDGGWYNQGHDYRFWEQFFNGAYQPGKALALSHSDYITDKTAHDRYCWKNLLQYNLMGDPEIPIWSSSPSTFNVTHADPIPSPGNYQFTVKDGSGSAVQGAVVCLMNGTTFYGEASTDSQGKASINLPSLTMQMNLTVSKRNFKPFTTIVNVGKDTQPPQMGMIATGGEWTTGDQFDITAFVSDNVAVSNVTIQYGYGSTVPSNTTNVSMLNTGPFWTFSTDHPSDSLDPFWFSIGAADPSGQWNHTSWIRKNITDNDLPEFLLDNTSFSATTGDSLTFGCHYTDNIATAGAVLNYTFDDLVWTNLPMAGSGSEWTVDLILPHDDDGYVRYNFNLTDTSGNFRITGNNYRDITDNDDPILISDLTVLPPRTGNSTTFHAVIEDNIEIFQVRLLFREQGGSEMNYSMTTVDSRNFTHSLTMASDRSIPVQYHYYIVDRAGNGIHTPVVNSFISDDDLPQITGMALPSSLTTGDEFRFMITCFDNILVQEVKAIMDHPARSGEILNGSYNSTSGKWDIDFTAPSHLVGNATIRIIVTDSAGNSQTSDPVTMPILDNDRPVLVEDRTPGVVYCLDTMTFEVEVEDNVEVKEVRLFRYGHIGYVLLNRDSRSNVFSISDLVPSSIDFYTYNFEIEDTSENVLVTETVSLKVTDDIDPVLIDAGVYPMNLTGDELTEVTTGEIFTIVAQIEENDLLNITHIEIEFPGEENLTVLEMTGQRLLQNPLLSFNRSADVSMPEDTRGDISYRFVLEDRSGNNLTSGWFVIELVDNDAPVVYLEEGDLDIETDSEQFYLFNAIDNVGIVDTKVWIPDHPDAIFDTQLNSLFLSIRVIMNDAYPSSTLYLHVEVTDGNLSTEVIVTLNLVDKSPPDVTFVEVPEEIELSATHDLKVTITDNVGWSDPSARWIKINPDLSKESQEIPLTPIVGVGAEASLEAPGTGSWILNFSVYDDNGNMFSKEFNYEISDDVEPVAELNIRLNEIASGQVMELDGSNTTDDSDIVLYTWTITKPDGTEDEHTGMTFQYKPDEPGDYTVELEVVDEFGNRAKTSTTITVTPMEDEDEDDPSNGWLLIAIVSISLLFLIIVLAAVFLAIRKGGKKEEELSFDEDTMEKAEDWEV